MGFPRKLLAPGEEVVLEAHPNWSILISRLTLVLLVLAGSVALVILWPSAPLWVGYVLLGLGAIAIGGVVARVVTWRSTTIVITNARIVYRTGVLRRLGREIPLDRVQDVTYRQNLLERMVGAGSLTVESAGRGGVEPFPDIAHPAMVQSLINRTILAARARSGAPFAAVLTDPELRRSPMAPAGDAQAKDSRRQSEQTAPTVPAVLPTRWIRAIDDGSRSAPDAGTRSSSEELARLVELHRLGVITDAELVDKRRELLRGS